MCIYVALTAAFLASAALPALGPSHPNPFTFPRLSLICSLPEDSSFRLVSPPEALVPFGKETSVISSYEHRALSDACSTGTPARWCPRRARVPVLQVTALSDAVSYTFLLQMKFQVRSGQAPGGKGRANRRRRRPVLSVSLFCFREACAPTPSWKSREGARLTRGTVSPQCPGSRLRFGRVLGFTTSAGRRR